MKKYIKSLERLSNLAVGSRVIFTFNDGTICEGRVSFQKSRKTYYIEIIGNDNARVFRELCLDKYNFVSKIVGYEPTGGGVGLRFAH